ncbi:hypothetical protein B566_EDAN009627 [Ephemera danica]|nr:hypothetical protein B566_EDAN009627 [Ephemera danica]
MKDGLVTVDEFKQAVKQTCVGKQYPQFPQAMKMFIDTHFKSVDINARVGDGQVSVDEFKLAVKNSCVGKNFSEFPPAMRSFIDSTFRSCDINGDGVIGPEEYRVDCVSRSAFPKIDDLDNAFQKLLNDDDKKRGGINLARYQELYAQFLGDANENNPANWLFGPLNELS